jgi:hypothetical protein
VIVRGTGKNSDLLLIALALDGLLGILSTRWRSMVGLDLEVLFLLRIWLQGDRISLKLVNMQGYEMRLSTVLSV